MMMCAYCSGFSERMNLNEPDEYFSLLDQVLHVLAEGTLKLVGGSCDLSLIERGSPWPHDYMEHVFQCAACQQRYKLSVKINSDEGGTWQAI